MIDFLKNNQKIFFVEENTMNVMSSLTGSHATVRAHWHANLLQFQSYLIPLLSLWRAWASTSIGCSCLRTVRTAVHAERLRILIETFNICLNYAVTNNAGFWTLSDAFMTNSVIYIYSFKKRICQPEKSLQKANTNLKKCWKIKFK